MWAFLRRTTLTQWIIIAMILGVVVGWLDNAVWTTVDVGAALKPLSTIFLRMIKSIVVPLIFGSLVVGIAGHGDDLKRVGRLALKSIVYFEVVTTVALLRRPGRGQPRQARRRRGAGRAPPRRASSSRARRRPFGGVLEHTVPTSFFDAAAKNEVLQVVFFTVLFAIALTQVPGRPKGGDARRSARRWTR